jgi:hypothetical protein
MKIARLLMLLLALSATVLSAAKPSNTPVRKGGGVAHSANKMAVGAAQASDSWWCNDGSDGGSCSGMHECMDLCMQYCGPPCTWYGET